LVQISSEQLFSARVKFGSTHYMKFNSRPMQRGYYRQTFIRER